MSENRPKLTRRRGACEECRQRKIRCDGANPCNQCERSNLLCEYIVRPSRRSVQGQGIQSCGECVSAATQPYTTDGFTIPSFPTQDRFSDVISLLDTGGSSSVFSSPFAEIDSSQLVSDSAYSYPCLNLFDETMSGKSEDKNTEPSHQPAHLKNQTSSNYSRTNHSLLEWLGVGYDEGLRQHSTAQLDGFLKTKLGNDNAGCTLASLLERTVSERVEAKPFLYHRMYDLTALTKKGDRRNRKQQAVLKRVETLLSSKQHACILDVLGRFDPSGEHQSLDLTSLPVESLVHKSFHEIGGLNLFINEQDVMRILQRCLDAEKPPIDVSDMSLLLTSLAWGALSDPKLASTCKTALLDAVRRASTVLLRQTSSVRQFLALVAGLCLAEKTGSDNFHALILGSVSTIATLDLHLESVLREFCMNNEQQAVQTKRAMWLLYCIDKSYATRWETFCLVSDNSIPIMKKPEGTFQSDIRTISSLQLLWTRFQYSRICSDILQLRAVVEGEPLKDHSDKALAISMALEEWYSSVGTNPLLVSLDDSDAMRIKFQMSYRYHEAQFRLISISLSDSKCSFPIDTQQCRELLKPSVREIIKVSSTIPSEYLLQDCNYLFVNRIALCFLALEILFPLNLDSERENQALLSIVVGFFARIDIELPRSAIFGEVSSLVELLAYR